MADIFDFYVYDDRSIQFAIAEPIMLEDKDVTQFRFRIPKVLNNIDMTDWEWWFIFVNAKKVKYTTQLTLTDDEDDPDNFSVATYTVGYGFSGYVGSVRFSIEALNVSGEEIVNEWHTKTYSTAVIDTLQGLRAVIPEPDGQVSTGITEEVKQALLQIARKVAYIDEHGQTYYDALYNALYAVLSVNISPSSITLNAIGNTSQLTATTVPEGANVTWTSSNPSVATVSDSGLVTSVAWGNATITATAGDKTATCSVTVAQASVVAITADYTQSGTVYTTASLDDLKSDLTVSAEWSDGTSSIVADTDYTLSGTLTEGTSTITVSYGGQNTTFNVTVTAPPTLQSITATYTQSGTVYDTDTLDSLKSDLVVTANYSDSTTETVTDYTLSGTLAEGTSTITVSYGGKTASFNVVVTAAPSYVTNGLIHRWDAIDNTRTGHDSSVNVWEDLVGTNDLTVNNYSNITWNDDSVQFRGISGTRFLGSEASTNASGKTLEIVFSATTSQTSVLCSMFHNTSNINGAWGKIVLYSDGTYGVKGGSDKTYTGVAIADFHSISASYDSATSVNAVYANAVAATLGNNTHSLSTSSPNPSVGASPSSYDYPFSGKIHAIRIYDRILTAEEVAQNYAVDVSRFNLG